VIYKQKQTIRTTEQISTDLVRDFAVIRRQNPDENEYIVCEKLWNFWYMQNKERIWRECSDFLCEKLHELRLQREKPITDDEIYKVYSDLLIIEAGINLDEYKLYIKAIKDLYKKMKKAGLKTQTCKKEVLKELKFLYKLSKKNV
jgi:hypothetical protein